MVSRPPWKGLERCLLAAGAVLVTVCGVALVHRQVSSRVALWQFTHARAAAGRDGASAHVDSKGEEGIDFSLWATNRIGAYRDSLLSKSDPPLAVLEIARLRLRVPVFDGTDDLTLNRGAGRISGTAAPGEPGNVGLAGHRDGFLRGLKDVSVGDEVELVTTGGNATYVVDRIEIVDPDDVWVLRPRASPSLTLVTCYPFYFVGSAPRRFIVQATLKAADSAKQLREGSTSR